MIDIGDILHVHLMKGDWVVMNRQPSLDRLSMMGFQVVPQDVKTFKVSLAVTKPLNANFHGDEMNCHVPQNPMATEVKELMATPLHILSPKNGMPIICIVQDAMVSMYLLTRRVVAPNSWLMDGIIDKSSLGLLVVTDKMYFGDYGAQRAAQFIDECQFLANRYMLYTGYSISIDDCVVIPRKVVKSIVDNDFLKANPLNPDVAVEDVKNKIMNMSKQQLNQNGNNGFMISVESG